jgi:hypothetical protein
MATLQKTVNKQRVLIARNTKILLVSFFSSTAHLPIQDVSGDALLKSLGSCISRPQKVVVSHLFMEKNHLAHFLQHVASYNCCTMNGN